MSYTEETTILLNSPQHELDSEHALSEAKNDKRDTLYWSNLLLGFGLLTPWSSFLSAVDYFTFIYPERCAMRWLTVFFYIPMLLSLVINSFIPFKVQGHNRIAVGFLSFSIFLTLVPIMDIALISGGSGSPLTFALLLVASSFVGASNGLVEGSVLGLTLFLPSRYYQAYTSGVGAAGVFVTLVRLVTKAAFADSSDGLRISACIFFVTSSLFCLLCFLVQKWVIMPHPIIQDALSTANHSSSNQTDQENHGPSIPKADCLHELRRTHFLSSIHFAVFKKLSISLPCIGFVYVVTFIIFPGVPSDIDNEMLGDWYKIILVLLFSIGDFVSRLVPGRNIWIQELPIALSVTARGLLVPVVFFYVLSFSHPIIISSLMLLLGMTNGYATLCCFALGQKHMQTVEESFIAGNFLIIALVLGINVGSLGSLGWARLATRLN